jgi:hypothetical protein
MMCRDLANTLVKPLRAAAKGQIDARTKQRNQIGRSNQPDDAQSHALLNEINAVGAYMATINNLWSEPAVGFSERLLKLFDDPLVRDLDVVKQGRAKAAEFGSDIDQVIASFEISDIERWTRGVEGDSQREH